MSKDPADFKKLTRYNIPGHVHELTFSCYNGQSYMDDHDACEIFLAELKKCRDEHLFRLWAYVLMPTHVHLLIWPLKGPFDISKMLNDVKGRTANQYRDHVQSRRSDRYRKFLVFDKSKKRDVFRFWQPGGGFDRNLWEGKAIHASIEYIEANPVRKQLAASPEEYRWSSAYARKRNEGLIPDRFNMPVALPDPQFQRVGVM